jgi:glycosyltransferase involved in cell wall biosynthesis
MRKSRCSIIIPSRNCINYLPTALNSIAAQMYNDLEVIIADDGSTDGTADWVAALGEQRFQLKLISTGGIGPSRARNAAIEVASSDVIAFLDADDIWWPGKIARQIEMHLANPTTGFSFTDYIHVGVDGRTFGTCFEFWRCDWTAAKTGDYFLVGDAEANLLATNLVGTSTVVANRKVFEAVNGFSTTCASAEDWDLWLRMANVADVACSNAVTMTYLMRPASETANRQKRLAAMRDIVARYQDHAEPVMRNAVRAAYARIEIAEAEAAREQGRYGAAATAHVRAMASSPSWRTARAIASDAVAVGSTLLKAKRA